MIPRNTLSTSITLCLAMTMVCAAAEKGAPAPTPSPQDETIRLVKEQAAEPKDLFPTRGETLSFADRLAQDWADQYQSIRWRLLDKRRRDWELGQKIRNEAFREAALIHPKDRDPVDVVLRQTEALAASLPPAAVAPFTKELASLAGEIRAAAPDASPYVDMSDKPVGINGRGYYIRLLEAPVKTPRYAQYLSLCRLQRRIALANPLLDFNDILCARRGVPMGHHAGYHITEGGSPGVIIPDSTLGRITGWRQDEPKFVDLLAGRTVAAGRFEGMPVTGGFIGFPSLSWDARTVHFSWWGGKPKNGRGENAMWKTLSCDLAGGPVRMMVDEEAFDSCAPCELPNGRIVFISTRRGGVARCGGPARSGILHTCEPDGSDITPISVGETSEYRPSVTRDGQVVYTRWDYVDRYATIAHHLWLVNPDGRDGRSPHGNYPTKGHGQRPDVEGEIKAIPGSHRFMAVASGHHMGGHGGSVIVIDLNVPDDDAMSQVRRVTPEIPFVENEASWTGSANINFDPRVKGGWTPVDDVYRSPWPLSEEHFLVTHQRLFGPFQGLFAPSGIYLADAFGNRVLLYQDSGPAHLRLLCDPIPLAPRQRPPVIPHLSATGRPGGPAKDAPPPPTTGELAVLDVYDADQPWPANTTITALRVMQIFPKANSTSLNYPNISRVTQGTARSVLGTVPVEKDGSAFLTVPADVPIYLQALDKDGRAVGTMRSTTHVPPGARITCLGCHESRTSAPKVRSAPPIALSRPPSALKPGPSGSAPIFYPLLVQPVLDRHCVGCHAKEREKKPKVPSFSTEPYSVPHNVMTPFNKSYVVMTDLFGWPGGEGSLDGPARSIHGQMGSFFRRQLKPWEKDKPTPLFLYDFVTNGKHHDVKLSGEDLLRLMIWQDNNCNFLGAYHETARQVKGELVLPDAVQGDKRYPIR